MSTECRDEKTKKKRNGGRLSPVILIALIVIIIGFFLLCPSEEEKKPEDYFVKYDNATKLVEVKYGEKTIFGYSMTVGFIDLDIYNKYLNDEYHAEKITVYHPYIRGESVTIDMNSIVVITERVYSSFYEDYPPSIYAD